MKAGAALLKQVEKKAFGTVKEVCKDLCKMKVYGEKGWSDTWSRIQKGDPPPLEGMIAKVDSEDPFRIVADVLGRILATPRLLVTASAGPPAATLQLCTSIASHLLLPQLCPLTPLPST